MQEFLSRSKTMEDIFQKTKQPFIIIIDEWDCILREYKEQKEAQRQYLDFLRNLLKDIFIWFI